MLRLVNAEGQPFAFEILLNGPSFERVALMSRALRLLSVSHAVRSGDDLGPRTQLTGQELAAGQQHRRSAECDEPGELVTLHFEQASAAAL